LEQYFPVASGVRIIAEPGRFFVASAFTLCVNIIAKRASNTQQVGFFFLLIDARLICRQVIEMLPKPFPSLPFPPLPYFYFFE
jgi:hypothetical protein